MPRSSLGRRTALAAVAVATALTVSSTGVGAQVADRSDSGFSLLLSAARAEYTRDRFCIDPDGWLSTVRLTAEVGAFAATAALVGAYPWPPPPPPLRGASFIDRGTAVQVGVELLPLRLLPGDGLRRLDRWVTPFVGGGVHLSRDGEPAAAGVNGDEPTAAILGGSDPFVAFGARVTLPLGGDRFGLFGEVRSTQVFDGGTEFVDVQGTTFETDSRTLSWTEFSVGVRLRLR